jgi:hypothetical protein
VPVDKTGKYGAPGRHEKMLDVNQAKMLDKMEADRKADREDIRK